MAVPSVEIIEIQGRSAHGIQEPFQCLADDGHLYYVKGCQTDRASLCHEWVCAHLGVQLGLPIPPFSLVHVPDALMAEVPPEWRSLGAGMAFGSRQHSGCTWFDRAQAAHVRPGLQGDILAFDWWIRNSDRTDGNPNLLWDAACSELVVIDHNLAFQPMFNAADFLASHIFRAQWNVLDLVARDALQRRFCASADAVLDEACDNLPPQWLWANPECDVRSNMDVASVKTMVLRCHSPHFWRFS